MKTGLATMLMTIFFVLLKILEALSSDLSQETWWLLMVGFVVGALMFVTIPSGGDK